MLNNPQRRAKLSRKNRLHLVSGSEFDIMVRRKAAIQAAIELKQKYAKPVHAGDIYQVGPSVIKNDEGVLIVATRNLKYEEPTFG
jgi:hypothetical protein